MTSRPVAEALTARKTVKVMFDPANPATSETDRETIEELIGRDYDLQELQVNMITMSGNLDQTDDEITLFWKS